jgi:hypothetical protein
MLMQSTQSCTSIRRTSLGSNSSVVRVTILLELGVLAGDMGAVILTVAQEGCLQSIEL